MIAKVHLLSHKNGEIDKFLNKFYDSHVLPKNLLSWKRYFPNPVEMSDIIAAFSDNKENFDINMWVSFDLNVFIKISPQNVNSIIKYIFERFPY